MGRLSVSHAHRNGSERIQAPSKLSTARHQLRCRLCWRELQPYDSGDFLNAAQVLDAQLRGQDTVGKPSQWAEFMLAKTYYHLGLKSVALDRFEAIARRGTRHRFHANALPWITGLLWELPRQPESLEVLDQYPQINWQKMSSQAGRLRYLLGLRAFWKSDLVLAASCFDRVDAK